LLQLVHGLTDHFGHQALYLTIVPFNPQGQAAWGTSTFADDNFDHLEGWLHLMTAKLFSGSVLNVSLIVRAFDFQTQVDFIGPHGPAKLPAKDLYMFFVRKEGVLGFDAATTLEMHCTDPVTGEMGESELGIRYRSSRELLRTLVTTR
jgi:hypothetical protein